MRRGVGIRRCMVVGGRWWIIREMNEKGFILQDVYDCCGIHGRVLMVMSSFVATSVLKHIENIIKFASPNARRKERTPKRRFPHHL